MTDKQITYCADAWNFILRQAMNIQERSLDDFSGTNFKLSENCMKAFFDVQFELRKIINTALAYSNSLKSEENEPDIS